MQNARGAGYAHRQKTDLHLEVYMRGICSSIEGIILPMYCLVSSIANFA